MELVRDISEELKSSYIDYAMSVIVGRAIPDVRDGLKPVQRRILYAMHEMGLLSNRPTRKSARIVGEVLGKYHPHGDATVYDALVRLAQDFVMRYPLVEGQGNFGSIDGDSPAAMRYTEARLTKIAEEMLADIEKETVDFIPNFDATLKEPVVLPAKIPNLLVNGSSGIAVGMATSIPPHNLREVCEAIEEFIKTPSCDIEDIMKHIKGPDFPTGGIIVGVKGIKEAYITGRGKIVVRGKIEKEGKRLVIKEIPYMVNKAKLVENIAELAREGKIDEIRTVRDESDREGLRIVLELRDEADADVVVKKLCAYSSFQTTFGIINLALVNNEPKILGIREMIEFYLEHRRDVVRRRTKFELEKAKQRLHIIEGIKKVLEDLDNAIQLIKNSKTPEEAKISLMNTYKLSEKQAEAVLQVRLQKLTSMEIDSLLKEHGELVKLTQELEAVLADPKKVDKIILNELREIKEKYGDERRTQIIYEEEEITDIDLVAEEDNLILVSEDGFVKRLSLEDFKVQNRGGVGVSYGMDNLQCVSFCNSLDKILIFTNNGKVFWINASEIPKVDRTSKGIQIRKLVRLENDEKIVSIVGTRNFEGYVIVLSPDGYIKKIKSSEFENAKRAGIIASSGEIFSVVPLKGREVVITTKFGYAAWFDAEEIPEYGRSAKGVVGIRLREGDEIANITCGASELLLTLTENGYGKRTKLEEFRKSGRGAMGVIAHKISEKTGKLVLSEFCGKELFAFSHDGYCIRVEIEEIPVYSRNSAGVIVSKRGIKKALVI